MKILQNSTDFDASPITPIACGLRDGAHALGISYATLRRRFVAPGKLTVFKCGHRSLVKVKDLQRIADEMPEAESTV